MADVLFSRTLSPENHIAALRNLFADLRPAFIGGDEIGIKLHWGERGNQSFLSPVYAREIIQWLQYQGFRPFVFDTTVLYSGGRRTGSDTLQTAAEHGYTEQYLGCPIVVADGMDGRDVIDIAAGFTHFRTVQVTSLVEKVKGFLILSHFKGHIASGFGGAIKNLSMGFASRAQKQRMHADVHPRLRKDKCTKCGVCVDVCPANAAQFAVDSYPSYDPEKCIGCAQCISLCPEVALRILWGADLNVFQEKIVETAAAVWKVIKDKTILVNVLLNITAECDCFPGDDHQISGDIGFLAGYHPVVVDAESLKIVGSEPFDLAHRHVPWQRQFDYACEIGFLDGA